MIYTMGEIQAFLAQLYRDGNGRPRQLLLTPWAYPLTFLALNAAATATQILNIQANGDFLVTRINHRAQLGAQTVSNKTAPEVRMLVTDSGSNEQFTSAAVDLESYSTNDAKIQNLPWPRLVQGKSSLTVQVTNYSAAENLTSLDIVFHGILIRAMG